MASPIFIMLATALLVSYSLAVDIESSMTSLEGRQASFATIFITTTIPGTTTTYTTTNKVCGVLGGSQFIVAYTTGTSQFTSQFNSQPTRVCRRKRGFYDEVYVGVQKDDLGVQFYRLSPSQIEKFEPTLLPDFPDGYSSQASGVVVNSPDVLQTSLARQGPIYGGLLSFGSFLSSFVSSIVSNLVTASRSTVTSTVSVYGSTKTLTVYTSTNTYFVGGTCYPGGMLLC